MYSILFIFIVILFSLLIGFIYLKFRFTTFRFFSYVVGQLVFVTLIFYSNPVREFIIVNKIGVFFQLKILSNPPPFWIYLTFVLTLIGTILTFLKIEGQKAVTYIETRSQIEPLKFQTVEEDKDRLDSTYKIKSPIFSNRESKLFYERVKKIFQLRSEKQLKIDIDIVNEILFGEIIDIGEVIPIFIKCDSSGGDISIDKITDFADWIKEFYFSKNIELPTNYRSYYITLDSVNTKLQIENLDLKTIDSNIRFLSESELLESIVPVKSYLNKIIEQYRDENLPFSLRTEKDMRFSLEQTFVPPSFNREEIGVDKNITLEEFLNQWIENDASPRQIALLGDYGTGKSSFLLHFAAMIAKNYKPNTGRIPIVIPLINSSPMLDEGLKDRLSRIANDMGINFNTLMYLIEKKRVVLMLDGFDEMGYVGNKEFRLKHFESIWKLAISGSKIIIAGRPSYFFSEGELNKALQAIKEDDIISVERPHCRLIKLRYLSSNEIYSYISKYYTGKELDCYFNFLQKNRHLFELASRPSLMHIIREMLPEIYENFRFATNTNKRRYTAGYLMNEYTKFWIARQTDKKIKGGLTDQKKHFFFIKLAEYLFLNRTEIVTPDIISKLMKKFLPNIDFSDTEKKDGIQGDILSGSFLQRQVTNSYKFVHRSFFEYFVARQIVLYIEEEKKSIPELFFTFWTEEITSFVSDLSNRKNLYLPEHIEKNQYYIQTCTIFKELAEIELSKNTEESISKSFFNKLLISLSLNMKLLTLKSKFINLSKISLEKIADNRFYIVKKPYIKKLVKYLIRSEQFHLFASFMLVFSTTIVMLVSLIEVKDSMKLKNVPFVDEISTILLIVLSLLFICLILRSFIKLMRTKYSIANEDILKIFRTALTNKTNVCFFRGDPTKDFIDDKLFAVLHSNIFIKSNALANHNFSNWKIIGKKEVPIDLSEANLSGACFRNAIIKNVSLKKSKLNNADFNGAVIKNVDFEGAVIDGDNLLNEAIEKMKNNVGGS